MVLEWSDRLRLLELARNAIVQVVTKGRSPEVPLDLLERYPEPRACFVTLEKAHRLRGCIGHIFPQEPLARAVVHNAAAAALRDSRFTPVLADELDALHIEVSVLTVPVALEYDGPEELLEKLRPHVDGVVLELAGRRSTFLPQVWESLPQVEGFLSHLALKAGLGASDWRGPAASVMTYQVESFTEALLQKGAG